MPFKTIAARTLACVSLFCGLSLPAAAQISLSLDFIPNYVGLGGGTSTRYTGASERTAVFGPAARYQFGGEGRYIQLDGPVLHLNLVPSEVWQFGPVGNLRFGRSDVEDTAVRQLPEIDTTVEAGLFGSWTHVSTGAVPIRSKVTVTVLRDIGNVSKGTTATVGGNSWIPLSRQTFVGLGAGLSWGDSAFMRTYYGIDAAGAAASGLPLYQPTGGLRQWYAWPAIVHRLDAHWLIGAGALYQSITGSAADSPIVERGKRGQLSYGVGVGYAW